MVNPLIAALAGGFLLFNHAASPRKAEQKFETELRKAFPAATIDVTISGKRGFDVVNGKFRSVRVDMRDFQVGPAASTPAPPRSATVGEISAAAPSVSPAAAQTAVAAPAPPSPAPMMSLMSTPSAQDRGHVGHTEIALKNFGLGPLKISSLDATFEDVTYDWKELKSGRALAIEKAGAGKMVLVIPASSFETLLRTRLQSIQNPTLSLEGGLVRITGTRAAPVIGAPVSVVFTGRPAVRGNEVRLEETALSLGGANMPAAVAHTLIGEINPVFNSA